MSSPMTGTTTEIRPTRQSSQPDAQKIDAYVGSIRGEFEDRLGHMVEIPTVSMDPAHKAE